MRILHFIIIIAISLFFTQLCAQHFLPYTSVTVSDSLFVDIPAKALSNLQLLPKAKAKSFAKILKQYPDIVMAYMIAYEQSATLAEADPQAVLSNYHTVIELLKTQNPSYPAELFLSYIAKQTVSDERIEAYRQPFLEDGLRQIMKENPEPLELYRAVSIWCLERLYFMQTSGRDQSPLDITEKTLVGRCEEMQILFVAACRVVGLPARPASAPYWAHTDNNHAWAEVYLDGAWHYTGDMDNAYYPNQTWFSGLIDKTVLILADGSLPAESDEVLQQNRYAAVINSTPNYAGERIRKLNLLFVDEAGNPIPKVQTDIMVYNWSSLRSIATILSNDEGKTCLSVGRGAFYVMAHKDSLMALCQIPSNDKALLQERVVLKKHLEYGSAIMDYPANAMIWKEAPPEYKEEVKQTKARWQERVDAFSQQHTPAFTDSLYQKVWELCRNNKAEFHKFTIKTRLNPSSDAQFLSYLLESDPKFLWQAKYDQFTALYHFFNSQAQTISNLGKRERESLISPLVFYEELPRPFGKKSPRLYPTHFYQTKAKSPREALNLSLQMLQKRHRIDNKKALNGLLRLDISSSIPYLNQYQYKILACSALKANGIPSEYSRIPDVINIYLEDKWQFYNVQKLEFVDAPVAETSNLATVLINTKDEDGLPLRLSEEQILLSKYQSGALYALNSQFDYLSDGKWKEELPAGQYYVQTGYRISDSQTFYRIDPLLIDDTSREYKIEIIARNYPHSWNAADPEWEELLREIEHTSYDYIIVGNYSQENSLRLADKLKDQNKSFLMLGYEDAENLAFPYQRSNIWQQKCINSIHQLRTLTFRKDEGGKWQMYEGMWDKLPE